MCTRRHTPTTATACPRTTRPRWTAATKTTIDEQRADGGRVGLTRREQDADRDGEIVRGAFFLDVGCPSRRYAAGARAASALPRPRSVRLCLITLAFAAPAGVELRRHVAVERLHTGSGIVVA